MGSSRPDSDHDPSYRYWAFISYSSVDEKWARWLHRAIESYGIPSQFVSHRTPAGIPAPRRFNPLFRDRDELPASSDLGTQIESALRASRYLIVVCSPEAARSQWVQKEIETFRNMDRWDRTFALIIRGIPNSGDANECFPQAIRTGPSEPKAADARPGIGDRQSAKLELLAAMLGVRLDALRQRDAQRRLRRMTILTTIALVVTIITCSLALMAHLARRDADKQRNIATMQRNVATQNLVRQYENEAHRLLNSGDPYGAALWLLRAMSESDDPAVEARCRLMLGFLKRATLPVTAIYENAAVTSDGSTLLIAGDGRLLISGPDRDEPGQETLAFNDVPERYSVSTDGRFVYAIDKNSQAYVWGSADGKPVVLTEFPLPRQLCVSADGTVLAVVDENDHVHVRSLQDDSGRLEITHGNTMINDLAFTGDGRLLVTAGNDGCARIWSTETGREVTPALKHNHFWVSCLAISSDGKHIATGGWDGAARVWSTETGNPETPWIKHQAAIRNVTFSPDDQLLGIASQDWTARIYSSATGLPVSPILQHRKSVNDVQFNGDGSIAVTVAADGIARLWNVPSGLLIAPPLSEASGIVHAAFSADQRSIVTTSADHAVGLRQAPAGLDLSVTTYRAADVEAFARGGFDIPEITAILDTVGEDLRRETAWDGVVIEPEAVLTGQTQAIRCLAISPDGRTIATGSWDGTVCLWHMDHLSEPATLGVGRHVDSVSFSPDGRHLLTAGDYVRVWDIETGRIAFTLNDGINVDGLYASYSPDGTKIVHAGSLRARVWDAHTGKPYSPKLPHTNQVLVASFSPDGTRVLTAAADGTACVWDVTLGTRITPLLQHDDRVRCAAFSHDGTRIITGSDDHTARVWNVDDGAPVIAPITHESSVSVVQFSSDDQSILTATTYGDARVWNVSTGEPVSVRMEHASTITAAQFSPDGCTVLTASGDQTCRLWDTVTGLPLSPPLRHSSSLDSALFATTGDCIVTGATDGSARIWKIPVDDRQEADILMWAKQYAAREIDETGTLVDLTTPQLMALLDQLKGN